VADDTLTHDEGWQFLRAGRALERAEKTARIVDVEYHTLLEGRTQHQPDHHQWMAVLKSVAAYEMYRREFHSTIDPRKVAQLLVLHPGHPRSIRFNIAELQASLQAISLAAPGTYTTEAERLTGKLHETLLYDRMRTVVLGTTTEENGARRPRFNTTFDAFARHWGFAPRLCQAYRAKTKGKVESGVKYVKRNFAPGRAFRDLEDFNEQLAAWQARVVAGDWLVSIESNRYSVPFGLIGKTVRVVREGAHWVIRYRGQVVAEHAVLAGRAQLSVRPEHGPGAAARNARKLYAELADEVQRQTDTGREVEVRDLAVYEQLLGTELEVA